MLRAVKINKSENQSICVYNPINCKVEKVFLDYECIQNNYETESIEILKIG